MEFFGNENLWLYLPLILWISGIFYLSSNKGSISNTSRFLGPVFAFLFPKAEPETLRTYHLYFRKICHFVGYGMLGLFASLAFYNSTVNFLTDFWYVLAFAVVFLIASSDEIKQSFYANRIGSFSDVILDCAGGLTIIFLLWLFMVSLF